MSKRGGAVARTTSSGEVTGDEIDAIAEKLEIYGGGIRSDMEDP